MGFTVKYEKLECKTLDGIFIRGWFYPVEGRAPVIIMSHGVRNALRYPKIPILTPAVQLYERNSDH
jgi:hypothetical protein